MAYDPLSTIPSAEVVRRKIEELEETIRRLKIVLKTAEQIERVPNVSGKKPARKA